MKRFLLAVAALLAVAGTAWAIEDKWDKNQNANGKILYNLPAPAGLGTAAVPLQFVAPAAGYLSASGLNGTISASATIPFGSITGGPQILLGTTGSVPYFSATNVIGQDNANFFWNGTTHRLGIGTTSPRSELDLNGTILAKGPAANVKAFGAAGDGVTNDTTAVQSAINAATNVYFPAGTYIVSSLSITTDGTRLFGDGNLSVVSMLTGSTGNMIDAGTQRVTVENLTLFGGLTGSQKSVAVSPANRIGLLVDGNKNSRLENLTIHGFGFAAIRFSSGINDRLTHMSISHVSTYNSYLGVYQGVIDGQYVLMDSLDVHDCYQGLTIRSANTTVTNSKITDNGYGVYVVGDPVDATNHAHGNLSDSLINHNDVAIMAEDVLRAGFNFVGNQIHGGTIHFKNSTGINVIAGTLDIETYLFEGGGPNYIRFNHLFDDVVPVVTHNYLGSADATLMIDNYFPDGSFLDDYRYLYAGTLADGVLSVVAPGVVSSTAFTSGRVAFGSGSNGKLTEDANFTYVSDLLTLSSTDVGGTSILLSKAGTQTIAKSGTGTLDIGTNGVQAIRLYVNGTAGALTIGGTGTLTADSLASAGTTYVKASSAGLLSTSATIPYADITGGPAAITSLTTDVVATGPGAAAATIQPDAVTYAKIQNVSASSRIMCRGSAGGAGDMQECTAGSGISIAGTVISATGVSDGDYGDITVSGSGAVWTIDSNAVQNSQFRQSSGLALVGRSVASAGDVSDIIAGSDGQVMRRSGATIGFGAIAESSVTNLTTDLAAKAPVGATFITQTPDATLTAEQALSAQPSGMLSSVTSTGVVTATAFTSTRIPFGSGSNGTLTDSSLFTYDGTSVLVGTATPVAGATMQVNRSINAGNPFYFTNPSTGGNAYSAFGLCTRTDCSLAGMSINLFGSGSTRGVPYGANQMDIELFGGSGNMAFWVQQAVGGFVWYTGTTFPNPTQVMGLSNAGVLTVNQLGTGIPRAVSGALGLSTLSGGGHRVLAGNNAGDDFEGSDEIKIDTGADYLMISTDGAWTHRNFGGVGATNYEEVISFWSGDVWNLKSQKGGSGTTVRDMLIDAGTATLTLDGNITALTATAGVTATAPTIQIDASSDVFINGDASVNIATTGLAPSSNVTPTQWKFVTANSITSATSAVLDTILFDGFGPVISGATTPITTATGINNVAFATPFYSGGGVAKTISHAATVAIYGAPSGTNGVTITQARALWVQGGGTQLDGGVGFGTPPVARPSTTGSRASGAALADLLSDLASMGLIDDNTTP